MSSGNRRIDSITSYLTADAQRRLEEASKLIGVVPEPGYSSLDETRRALNFLIEVIDGRWQKNTLAVKGLALYRDPINPTEIFDLVREAEQSENGDIAIRNIFLRSLLGFLCCLPNSLTSDTLPDPVRISAVQLGDSDAISITPPEVLASILVYFPRRGEGHKGSILLPFVIRDEGPETTFQRLLRDESREELYRALKEAAARRKLQLQAETEQYGVSALVGGHVNSPRNAPILRSSDLTTVDATSRNTREASLRRIEENTLRIFETIRTNSARIARTSFK